MDRTCYIPFSACLPAAYLLPTFKRSPGQVDFGIDGARSAFSYSGSAALGLAANSLKRCHRTHLVAPAYHCGHEIEPFLRQDFKLSLYRVNRQGKIDLDHLDSLVKGDEQVVLITHYFGFPHDIQGVYGLCRARGAYLLEDCAHAFQSRLGNRPLGSWGDISIFSLRKSLPIPDGGAVIYNNPEIPSTEPSVKPSNLAVWRKTAKLLSEQMLLTAAERSKPVFEGIRALKQALLLLQSLWLKGAHKNSLACYSPDDPSYDFSSDILGWGISDLSLRILAKLDFQSIFQRRRANYLYVHAALKSANHLRSLHAGLPEGVCPLVFPLVVEEKNPRANTVMSKYPFLVRWWPHGHPAVKSPSFDETDWLFKNCYILGVHQDLQKRHLDHLIELALKADAEMD